MTPAPIRIVGPSVEKIIEKGELILVRTKGNEESGGTLGIFADEFENHIVYAQQPYKITNVILPGGEIYPSFSPASRPSPPVNLGGWSFGNRIQYIDTITVGKEDIIKDLETRGYRGHVAIIRDLPSPYLTDSAIRKRLNLSPLRRKKNN